MTGTPRRERGASVSIRYLNTRRRPFRCHIEFVSRALTLAGLRLGWGHAVPAARHGSGRFSGRIKQASEAGVSTEFRILLCRVWPKAGEGLTVMALESLVQAKGCSRGALRVGPGTPPTPRPAARLMPSAVQGRVIIEERAEVLGLRPRHPLELIEIQRRRTQLHGVRVQDGVKPGPAGPGAASSAFAKTSELRLSSRRAWRMCSLRANQ